MTRETVEALLRILSPRCKLALEAALDTPQLELSEACKVEIRAAVPHLVAAPRDGDAAAIAPTAAPAALGATASRSSSSSSSSRISSRSGSSSGSAHSVGGHLYSAAELVLSNHYYAGALAVFIFVVVVGASLLAVRIRDGTAGKRKKGKKR